MIYFAVDELRIDLVNHLLVHDWGRPLRDRIRPVAYPELFRTRSLPRGVWIFTALDALPDAELWMVHHLQSAARDAGLTVLNPAREALHRYGLLEALHGAGINEFRAHRADGPLDDVRFPVFVRVANEHDGSLTPVLHDRAALRRAMAYLRLRGLAPSKLLVVEFCDTAGEDGFYRKYSIFRVGDIYVPRNLHIAAQWVTKHHSRSLEEAHLAEEMDYLYSNPHEAWARKVFELAHIEYGRLDYGFRDGRPQAWEINFTPVLAADPNRTNRNPAEEEARRRVLPAKAYAHDAFRAALERLDLGLIAGGDIRVEFPAALVDQARRERSEIESLRRRRRWIDRIAAVQGARAVGPLLRKTFLRKTFGG